MLNYDPNNPGFLAMEYSELIKLEENVKRAIEVIEKLVRENQKLMQENSNLISQIQEKDQIIRELKIRSDGEDAYYQKLSYYKEKEGKIRKKIQQILEKLEAIR